MRYALLAALVSVLASAASAQKVFVVGPVGSFFDAVQLGIAIDAAQNGDIILVRSGMYPGFTLQGKSISIVADVGAQVLINHSVAMSIPANGRVYLRGLRFIAQTNTVTAPLTLLNVACPVWIEECTFEGDFIPATLDGCEISNCASVTFQRSTVLGTSLGLNGGRALLSTDSHVSLLDCVVRGGNGYSPMLTQPDLAPGLGGLGARIEGGSLFTSGTTIQGGAGGSQTTASPPHFGGDGGVGLENGCTVTVVGGVIAGGTAGTGAAGSGAAGNPTTMLPGGSIATLALAARHCEATSPVRELQSSTFTLGGVPGETAAVLFSNDQQLGFTLFGGEFVASIANAYDALSLGTVPASGIATAALPFPQLPASIQGATFFFQSFFFDTPLTYLVIGPATAVVWLDSSL